MGYNKARKEWCAREKYEVDKTVEDNSSRFPELEEGEFRKDEPFGQENLAQKDIYTGTIKLSSSADVMVKSDQGNARQSMPLERGTHQGSTANARVRESDYSTFEDQSVNLRRPTFHRKHSEKHHRRYSPSFHISTKERYKQRKQNCFKYEDYRHVRRMIEEVCSERLSKLVLHHNEDRKEFNILLKKQELEFFREHLHAYKVRYERVIPLVRYDRNMLPKLLFSSLRKIFRKLTQPQLIKFVEQQINDRNKERRMKERWIFEAKSGYLKKYFNETSLSYSKFEMGKSKWHAHDYPEGEQVQYFDLQSLCSAIEAIASSNELSDPHKFKNIDVCNPVVEDVKSPLRTYGATKHQLSVAAADEIATIDSMPSQSNRAPAAEFGEKVGTQVSVPSPPQNKEESVGRSCSSAKCIDETLEIAEAVSADSRNIFSVPREKQRCASVGGDASEGSCSMSQRNLPHEFVPNFHGTALYYKEPQAARLSSVNVNQREEHDNAGRKDVSDVQISSVAQATEQRNKKANLSTLTKSSTELQHCDQIGQNAAHPSEQSNGGTCSARTGAISPGASIVQQQPTNQMMTRSIVNQCTPEVRCQSDPITVGLNEVIMPCRDHSYSFSQATQQRNIDACSLSLTQHVTQHPHLDQICQTVDFQYQRSGGNATLVRTWLDSLVESNVQQQSANQTTTGSTSEHMRESRLGSDPFTIELKRLLMLRDLMTKRHLSVKQKINLEYEMEVAQLKKKYDDLFHNLEMETLQKKKDLDIFQENLCKHQILADIFQVLQASDPVVSCSQRGEPSRAVDVPNQPSGQQTVWFPASATMYQPPQAATRSSTHQFLRQPSMSTLEGPMDTSGRSTATSTSAPRGVMGTRIACNAPAPHLRLQTARLER